MAETDKEPAVTRRDTERATYKDEGARRFGATPTGAAGEQPPTRQLHRGPEGPIISDSEKPQPVGEQSLEFGSGRVMPKRMSHDEEHKSGSTDAVIEEPRGAGNT